MKKRLLIVLLVVVTILSLTLVACKPEPEPKPEPVPNIDIDIMAGWAGNENEEVYDISKVVGGKMSIAYTKTAGMEWAYAKKLFTTLDATNLAKMKTLSFTCALAKTAGSNEMLIKFEFLGDPAPAPVEYRFLMETASTTYEVDLSKVDVTKIARTLLFVDVEGSSGIGSIEFTSIKLTDKAINNANDIKKFAPGGGVVVDKAINAYTEGATFAANKGWYDSGDGIYAVKKDAAGFKVDYSKRNGAYPSMKAYVSGNLSEFKKILLTIVGTKDKSILIKPYDRNEMKVVFTGAEQVVEVAIKDIAGIDWKAESYPIVIMAEGGVGNVTGTFTIKDMTFSKEAVTPPTDLTVYYEKGDTLDINKNHKDAGDGKWTFAEAGGIVTATYPANLSWSSFVVNIDTKAQPFNTLTMTVIGTAGHSAIFKLEYDGGVAEKKFETDKFTGQEETFSIVIPEKAGKMTLRVFGNFVDNGEAGSIQIKSAKLQNVLYAPQTGNFDIAKNFVNAGDNRFNFAYGETGATISYTTAGWDTFVNFVDLGAVGTYKKVTFTVKGLAGHSAIFKVDTIEHKFENDAKFTGETQTFEIDTSKMHGIITVRIFLDWDAWTDIATVPGSLIITSAILSK
ncbi:MAG: hypothetical protein RR086_03285 [Clostridia bacterium]